MKSGFKSMFKKGTKDEIVNISNNAENKIANKIRIKNNLCFLFKFEKTLLIIKLYFIRV